ncbi:MAG: RlmE family RNA methyltransferase [Rickettsiales bacterium]|nr:RlmE family RNA methyltransferase [Rickettsiales bacterium]
MANKRTAVKKVLTAKGRRISSTNWLKRQLNDPFTAEAKQRGYRSRAAFKILEIDEKFKIFKKGQKILDLGSAPGGWSQVVVEKVGKNNVLALDILQMDTIDGVDFVQQDFTKEGAESIILEKLNGKKCDVVLSDMAANTTGDKRTDHLRTLDLLEKAFDFSLKVLNRDGVFVGKVFQGGLEKKLFDRFKKNFASVKHFKPISSRKESVEMYIVALEFRGGLSY